MSEENKYIYSHARLKQELVEKRRFEDFSKYGSCSELEWLCKQYLHPECVHYQDVEWKALNVTADVLTNIVKWIDNDYESARLLVYFSDHSRDILDDDDVMPISNAVYEHFEKECARLFNRLYKKHKSQQGTTKLFNGEFYPNMEMMGIRKYPSQKTDTYKKRSILACYCGYKTGNIPMYDTLIKPFLPVTQPNGSGLFEASDVFNATMAIRAHTDIQFQKSSDNLDKAAAKICDINALINFIKIRITMAANRMLLGRTQPVLQTLFVLAVYWSMDDYNPAYTPYFRESAKVIKSYLNEHGVPTSKIEQCINDVTKAREEKQSAPDTNNSNTTDAIINLEDPSIFYKLIIAEKPDLVLQELHRRIDGRKGKDIGVVLAAATYIYHVLSRTPSEKEFNSEFRNIQKCTWKSISEWLKRPPTERDIRPDIKAVILNFKAN